MTAERSQADLRVISQRFKQTINYGGTLGARVTPISDALRGGFRQAFFILAGAVACVLAIACVNLSNLLLARINVRRQEFAVRVALGARRRHLVEQALAESLLLAVAGAVVGWRGTLTKPGVVMQNVMHAEEFGLGSRASAEPETGHGAC